MTKRIDTRASIRTHYVGPTNHRGSRVVARDDYPPISRGDWPTGPSTSGHSDERRRVVVNWDHALNSTENHVAAADAFLRKFNPEAEVVSPGLGFDGCYYWTWQDTRGGSK